MAATNRENNEQPMADKSEPFLRIDPPASCVGTVKEPLKLLFEIIYLFTIFVPLLVWSIVEYLFLTERKSINGNVVLVTGAGRGLGRGFAIKFAELGCTVACADVDENTNRETVELINEGYPGKAKAYTCNVALTGDIKALKKNISRDFGHVNILVHNAGLLAGMPITDFDDAYLHGLIAVNLSSHFLMIREFLPDMKKRNEGHIVAVSSLGGLLGTSNVSMYTATKHGIIGLMDCLNHELKEIPNNKIRTTTICPYFINTSALYNRYWNTRYPELSVEEVVNVAVDGILRNERLLTIPRCLYYSVQFMKLLPDRIVDLIRNIAYVKINLPPKEVQEKFYLYKILNTKKNWQETIEYMYN